MIRTIKGVVAKLKKSDPDWAITEYFVRQLCREDKIPCQRSDVKYLIDVNNVKSLFNME